MPDERLGPYRRKRRAGRTPEPVPPEEPLPRGDDDTFVVQEHHARRLHWDLRLERDGVLVSWAVPRGLPTDPKVNHLAVHTEDHPLEYATFAGEIPKGEYGAGTMTIWDRGRYDTEKWTDREVKIVLHGTRAAGRYVLFQTDGRNWMMHRMDPAADPAAEPMPAGLLPLRPQRRSRLPRGEDAYGFEFAWGGVRVLAYVEGGRARFADGSREQPAVPAGLGSALGAAFGTRAAVLDGELAEVGGEQVYLLFDLLHLDGRSLLGEPYEARRRTLDGLGLSGPRWQTAPWFSGTGAGAAVRSAAREQGLPGVLAKRLDSPYEPAPGRRPAPWILVPVEP